MSNVTQGLTWQNFINDGKSFMAALTFDFSAAAEYVVYPHGAFGVKGEFWADGAVVDNTSGGTAVTVSVGPLSQTIPAYTRDKITLVKGVPPVRFSGGSGVLSVTFYTGTFIGFSAGQNIYSSNTAANVASLTSGTVDAYFLSLRFAQSYHLPDASDLNALLIGGFYDVLNPVNGPGAGAWQVGVQQYSQSANSTFQIAISTGTNKSSWARWRIAGVWGAWLQDVFRTDLTDGTTVDAFVHSLKFALTTHLPAATDFNTVVSGGFYDLGGGPTNGPTYGSGTYVLEVVPYSQDTGYVYQRVADILRNGARWERWKIGGVWGAWASIAERQIGEIIMMGCAPTQPGWIYCDGAVYAIATYPALYAAIGITFGGVAGIQFQVPDFTGRSPVGYGLGTHAGITNRVIGTYGGEETHTLTIAEMPAHNHDLAVGGAVGTSLAAATEGNAAGATSTAVASKGGGGAHNTLHPFLSVGFYIFAGTP